MASLPQIVVKLKALRGDLYGFASAMGASVYVKERRAAHYFERFASLAAGLRRALPTMFFDLHEREIAPDKSGDVDKDQLADLMRDMDYCLEILARVNLEEQAIALRVAREGAYFAGQQFDAIRQVQEILSLAKQEIVLIDGYIDERTLALMTVKGPGVRARLLTKGRSITPAFRGQANAFNQQYRGLEVRTSEAFHDRFLFLDGSEFFHFGTSFKDAGGRAFMFSRIEEPAVLASLREQWSREWERAAVVV